MFQIFRISKGSRVIQICLHVIAWAIFFFFPFLFYRIKIVDSAFFIKQTINVAVLVGFFYFNIFYLIPLLLSKKRFFAYFSVIFGIIISIIIQQFIVDYQFDNERKAQVQELQTQLQIVSPHYKPTSTKQSKAQTTIQDTNPNETTHRKPTISHIGQSNSFLSISFPEIVRQALFSSLFILLLSVAIKLGQEWFKTEKIRKELENQQLNAELALLKSQVNPHFLFNTLNSIYSLAHKKSAYTEKAIMMLSELMRYMMVDSVEKFVPLDKEIQYIKDYISLQKLRFSRDIDIDFVIEGDPGSVNIAPMLLITFVENAIKHGISYMSASFIHINLTISNSKIDFVITNSLAERPIEDYAESGHGLENVRKRLELLYKGNHILEIRKESDSYFVRLVIKLTA
jgi:hypothetical protein